MNFKPDLHYQDMAIFQDPAKKLFVSQFFPNGLGLKRLSKKNWGHATPKLFFRTLRGGERQGEWKEVKGRPLRRSLIYWNVTGDSGGHEVPAFEVVESLLVAQTRH